MKIVCLTLLFLAMQSAHALGWEEAEYVGKVGQKRIVLEFREDVPTRFEKGLPVSGFYGNVWIRELSFCEVNSNDLDKLPCSTKIDEQPNVVYIEGNSKSAQFQTARNLYKEFYPKGKIGKWNSEGVFYKFYVCQKGCSAAVPSILIMITHGD